MKITRDYLRELIKIEMGGLTAENPNIIKEVKDEPMLNVEDELAQSFESVKDHNLLNEAEKNIEELKSINSEIKRMKQLVDFRRPLLSDEDFLNF